MKSEIRLNVELRTIVRGNINIYEFYINNTYVDMFYIDNRNGELMLRANPTSEYIMLGTLTPTRADYLEFVGLYNLFK